MESLSGKVVLVTGASSGIGAAICRKFANHRMIVVGAARREERLKALEEEVQDGRLGEFHGIRCDLSDETDILRLFTQIEKKFGRLDVCVSNAGIAKNGAIIDGHTDAWKEMLQLNVLATAICLRESIKLMRSSDRDSGHIITVGSNHGYKVPPAAIMHFYAASKFAVRAVSEGLRQELVAEKSRIRVTHIAVGSVRTEAAMTLFPSVSGINEILYKDFVPLEAKDVADVALYAIQAPPNVNINEVILNPVQGDSPGPPQLA